MNKFVKALIDKLNKKYKGELGRQKNFFKKPDVLTALGTTSVILLDKMIKEQKTKKELKDQIQNNKIAKDILTYNSIILDENNLSSLLNNCLNGKTPPDIPDGLEESDFLSYVDRTNDIDNKINFKKLQELSDKLGGSAAIILGCSFIIQYIIQITKELLTKTEHPSKYRMKYIQNLVRTTYGLLKLQTNSSNINNDIKFLKQIDNIIIAIGLATSIYIINKKIIQKKSKETLDEITQDIICQVTPEASDPSINRIPFNINLNCPTVTDDELVPHIPIELKIQNPVCEINQNNEIIVESSGSTDLVTHLIIRNTTNKNMSSIVPVGSFLTVDKQIGIIDGSAIYAPMNGYVENISNNEIIMRDVFESDEDLLISKITDLNQKYERLNDVKSFVKNYYVNSIYPQLISEAIVDDASTLDIISGVNLIFKKTKNKFNSLNESYEKNIKKITYKDNVEKNAKDETLYKIKDDFEKEDNIFFKNIINLIDGANNLVKVVKPDKEEYQLFEYYFLDIGINLNALVNPSGIEIEYRNIINEFAEKRFILEKYEKDKLKIKIINLLKEIQKNKGALSTINLFDLAIEKYNLSKNLNEIKLWLKGLANENDKLVGDEKTVLVNKIIYVFELYISAEQLKEKYSSIVEKDTLKLETIIEGNKIRKFSENLLLELNNIPKEIIEIQKIISEISLFQTYSITEWNGYQARLYVIADEPHCKSSETNDYLNPKSKKGFGDIEYWLKYCSIATLASVTNPVNGWSTGWIIPSPILMPVIYIPIKAINTAYGFIVIGISICGIWVFPWSLFVNYSPNHPTPFGDPTNALKKGVTKLKKEISESLRELKKSIIKKLLDKTKNEIKISDNSIKTLKNNISEHSLEKPKKTKIENNVIKNNLNYTSEKLKWEETNLILKEKLLSEKTNNFKLTLKYKILNDAYKTNSSVEGIEGVEEIEKKLNKKLDSLVSLIDKIDLTLAPLPISLKPNSANFGFTLKNPKPVIKIADELDDNVNEEQVNKIFNKFEVKNEELMSSKFESKLNGKITNFKSYKQTLSSASLLTVKKDPFPKYELLKLTNVQWLKFLYTDFVKSGATTYGFPGNNPQPI